MKEFIKKYIKEITIAFLVIIILTIILCYMENDRLINTMTMWGQVLGALGTVATLTYLIQDNISRKDIEDQKLYQESTPYLNIKALYSSYAYSPDPKNDEKIEIPSNGKIFVIENCSQAYAYDIVITLCRDKNFNSGTVSHFLDYLKKDCNSVVIDLSELISPETRLKITPQKIEDFLCGCKEVENCQELFVKLSYYCMPKIDLKNLWPKLMYSE